MTYTDEDMKMAQERQIINGYGEVPLYYITQLEHWPQGLGVECYFCKYVWMPEMPSNACPRCKRYFWKGRWPRIVAYERQERMRGPEEITFEDPNVGQMIDIHYFECSVCGKSVPYILKRRDKQICVDCLKISAEDRDTAREKTPDDERPAWEKEEFPGVRQSLMGRHVPEFGEDVMVTGTCTNCHGEIDNDVAQQTESGELYCAPCLSFYMQEGRLPTSDEASQRRSHRP